MYNNLEMIFAVENSVIVQVLEVSGCCFPLREQVILNLDVKLAVYCFQLKKKSREVQILNLHVEMAAGCRLEVSASEGTRLNY